MKTLKKTLAILLAAVMTLSMGVVAFAEDCAHESVFYLEADENPICGRNGHIACWCCDSCYSAYFADEERTQPLTYEEVYCIAPAYQEHDIQYELGFEQSDDHAWLSYDTYMDSYYQQNFGMTYSEYYASIGYTYWYCSNCGAIERYGSSSYPSYSRINGIFTVHMPGEVIEDPNEGFILLPTADSDALEDGAYWYDLAGFIDLMLQYVDPEDAEMMQTAYGSAEFYLSEDGGTLRMVMFGEPEDYDVSDPDNSMYTSFLKQHGVEPVDPNEGFILLPTEDSDEFETGDYWFDKAGFIELVLRQAEPEEYDSMYNVYNAAVFYLSEDENTLRIIFAGQTIDMDVNDPYNAMYIRFLKQHGVDPYEGFNLLPTEDSDELEDGDYYFDVMAYVLAMAGPDATDEVIEEYLGYLSSYDYYLSDDGNTLLIVYSYGEQEIGRNDDAGMYYFIFVRQHGVEPADALEGFDPVAYSTDDIPYGGYLFLLDDYLDDYASSMAGEINYATNEPYTAEEIAAEIAQTREEVLATAIYINKAEGKLGLVQPGTPAPMIFDLDSEIAAELVEFITYWEPEWIPVFLTTDGIAAGDYWFDAAAFLGADAGEELEDFISSVTISTLPDLSAFRITEFDPETDQSFSFIIPADDADWAEDYAAFAAYTYVTFADSKDATCLEDGYTGAIAIEKDGENVILVAGEAVEALGHDFDESIEANVTVVEATCTVDGLKTVKCSRCDETDETVLTATGHTFGAWETVTAATCHSKGLAERRCACGETEQKELDIDPSNHDGETELRGAAAATCTEAGYTGDTYCLGCGNVKTPGKAIAAAGHQWGEWTVTVEATDTEAGEEVRECAVCHETETRTVPAKDDGTCPYCGEYHDTSTLFGWLTSLIHDIIFILVRLFSWVK